MPLSDEIARLYQLPLAQFTAERNELLKRAEAGAEKARVRALQKPSLPAWAVNQLYWQHRPIFDRLATAAEQLRAAHMRQLGGGRAEVPAAERGHQGAIKAAAEEIRSLLRAAGETASAQTMAAVTETLQALPTGDPPGQLVKPLRPMGFEALSGLMPAGKVSSFPAAKQAGPSVPRPAPAAMPPGKTDAARAREAAAAKQATAARRKDIAAAEKELREAAAAEREARAALARVEMSLARARRERKELEARLDAVTVERDRLSGELDQQRKRADRATTDREHLEHRLGRLRGGA